MKKSIKLAGIIAIVVVIGFLFIACRTTKGELDGTTKDELNGTTWRGIDDDDVVYIISFNSPNFTITVVHERDTVTMKGTYSVSGSTVTMISDGETSTGILTGNRLIIDGEPFTKQ